MPDLISEPLSPVGGAFDAVRMGRGEPGLPTAFTWRGNTVAIVEELACWKQSERASGQLYLRRHYFRLRMADGTIWTVYFVRHTPRTGDPKKRWFLYTREDEHSLPP
jgi:hypothetical protein